MEEFDVNKVCRTCLSNRGEMISIYDCTTTSVCLGEMLTFCTSVKFSGNNMPTQICHDCVNGLNQSYNFAIKCKESDEKLQLYFQNKDNQHLLKHAVDYVTNIIQHLPEENQNNEDTCSHLNEIAYKSNNSLIESRTSIRIRNDLRDQLSSVENQSDLNIVPLAIIPTQSVAKEIKTEVPTVTMTTEADPQMEQNCQLRHLNWLKSEINSENEIKYSISIGDENMPALNDLLAETTLENGRDIKNVLRDPLEINNISVELDSDQKIDPLTDQTSLLSSPKCELSNENIIETNSLMTNKLQTLQFLNNTNDIINPIDNSSSKETCVPHNLFNSFVLLERCDESELINMALLNSKATPNDQKNPNIIIVQCTVCEKTFKRKDYLRRHMMVHERKKPFCMICEKSFRGNYELTRHMSVHEKKSIFSCNICGEHFKQECHFSVHMLKHASVTTQSNNEDKSSNAEHTDDEHSDNVIHRNEPSENCQNDLSTLGITLESELSNTGNMKSIQSDIDVKCMLSDNILLSKTMDNQRESINNVKDQIPKNDCVRSEIKDSQNIRSNNPKWQMYGLRKRIPRNQSYVENNDENCQSETSNSDQCHSASSNYTDSESVSSSDEDYELNISFSDHDNVRSINVKDQTEQSNHPTNSESEVSINVGHLTAEYDNKDCESEQLNSRSELVNNVDFQDRQLNTAVCRNEPLDIASCHNDPSTTEGSQDILLQSEPNQRELFSNIDSQNKHSNANNHQSNESNNGISQFERINIKDCLGVPSNNENVQSNQIYTDDTQIKLQNDVDYKIILLNTENNQLNQSKVKVYEIALPYKENGQTDGSNIENCPRKLTSSENCKSKLLKANKNNKCTICAKEFRRPCTLKDHMRTHINPKKRHKCQVCAHPFRDAADLKEHMQVHSGENPFACSFCEKIFFTPRSLRIHMQSHDDNKPYSCRKCDMKFFKHDYLHTHEKVHMDGKRHKCKVCSRLFRKAANMRKHMKTHSNEKLSYSCSICKKAFFSKSNYDEHMQLHNNKAAFPCPICNEFFNSKSQARTHLSVHSGEGFICSVCGKNFTKLQLLQSHIQTHSGEKLFACTKCDRSYKSGTRLSDHMRRVHPKGERLTCDICNRSLKHKVALRRHMLIHSEKKHQCSLCDKSFRIITSLQIHTRTHTNERPFSCTVCAKAYKAKSNLCLHMRTHNDERRFACTHCDLKFKIKHHLTFHIERKHPGMD